MLQIRSMGEEDRFFAFTNRLKEWAQNELRRQNVTTLAAAYEAADRLTDWHSQGGSSDVKGKEKRGPPNLKAHNTRPFKKMVSNSQGGGSRPPVYGKNVAKKFPSEKATNVNPFKPKDATVKSLSASFAKVTISQEIALSRANSTRLLRLRTTT